MTYETPAAFRMALEHRLLTQSDATKVALDRLRRRVVFERILARLERVEPGRWVLKGGMALEVRLQDNARLTKDVDLGLRDQVPGANELRERLIDALTQDPDGDRFVLRIGPVKSLAEDGSGHPTWRVKVRAELAGKVFGGIQVDVSARVTELTSTDLISLPNSLEFAQVETPKVEVVDIHRHAAEKYHAMLKDFGDRENSRVRDLIDLIILREHGLVETAALGAHIRTVWRERDRQEPPLRLPDLPATWQPKYEQQAAELNLATTTFDAAVGVVSAMWVEIFTNEGV